MFDRLARATHATAFLEPFTAASVPGVSPNSALVRKPATTLSAVPRPATVSVREVVVLRNPSCAGSSTIRIPVECLRGGPFRRLGRLSVSSNRGLPGLPIRIQHLQAPGPSCNAVCLEPFGYELWAEDGLLRTVHCGRPGQHAGIPLPGVPCKYAGDRRLCVILHPWPIPHVSSHPGPLSGMRQAGLIQARKAGAHTRARPLRRFFPPRLAPRGWSSVSMKTERHASG